jgi:crossover junction endodeoxyribonuclease RuvC
MIILGVDPGTLVTGYGVIEFRNGARTMLACGVVKNRGSRSMPLRLKSIYEQLVAVIDKYHPDEFAIETAFYGKNAQSALKIGHARGVSILAAVNRQIPTAEYAPRAVKKAVVGNGAASKQQVRFMVRSMLRNADVPSPLDVSDALAVALCHSFRLSGSPVRTGKARSRGAKASWSEFLRANPERIVRRP